MAKRMVKSRKKRRSVTGWHPVLAMGVEVHTSKRSGREMLRVSFDICEDVKEWPVDVYFDPSHPNDFMRQRWLDWKTEQEAHGGKVRGKSLEAICDEAEGDEDVVGWVQPEIIGVHVSEEKDDDGQIRESWDVLVFDWDGEHIGEVDPDELRAIEEDTAPSGQPEGGAGESGAEGEEDFDDDLPF